jgi:hypothetical protein
MYSPLKEEIQAKRPRIAISKTWRWDWDVALARLWRRLAGAIKERFGRING